MNTPVMYYVINTGYMVAEIFSQFACAHLYSLFPSPDFCSLSFNVFVSKSKREKTWLFTNAALSIGLTISCDCDTSQTHAYARSYQELPFRAYLFFKNRGLSNLYLFLYISKLIRGGSANHELEALKPAARDENARKKSLCYLQCSTSQM